MRQIIILILITMLLITGCTQEKELTECEKIEKTIKELENKINEEGIGCNIIKQNEQYKLTFSSKESETTCRPIFNEYIKIQEEYKKCE